MIYTIGFTKKSAEEFFELLKANNVKKLIDIRLNNKSQLAGFTKGNDLKYFLKEICSIEYEHRLEFAPTKDILDSYKKGEIDWVEYVDLYNKLLEKRKDIYKLSIDEINNSCFLCSEDTAENCHRRLLAEKVSNLLKIDVKHI